MSSHPYPDGAICADVMARRAGFSLPNPLNLMGFGAEEVEVPGLLDGESFA